jgi:ATP-dependent Clp protease ATP-binding subunit ClpA
MRAWIARNLPVLIAVSVVLMLLQLLVRFWPSASGWNDFRDSAQSLLHQSGWFVAAAGLFAWLMVWAVWSHDRGGLPSWARRCFPVDILDRLSNRQLIEAELEKLEVESVILDATSLTNSLKSKLIGQDQVCDDIAQQLRRRLALESRDRPVGVFLFAGPPGTGKTYLAKLLAQELGRRLLHLDMTQFSAGPFSASQLFGMTKGYVGSDTYGKLTAGLRDAPTSVVLLDEIEKAHPEVVKGFLTAWNDGFVTEASDGKAISTREAIFILTSNAATDALARLSQEHAADPDTLRKTSVAVLREAKFAPEVLNRVDRIFVFRPLAGLDVARVGALEMEAMIRRYGLETAAGGIDPQIIVELIRRCRKLGSEGSTRDVVRAIEEAVADSLIQARQQGFTTISLTLDGGRVTARASRASNDGADNA